MNSTKTFIIFALILGAIVAVGEMFFVFFGGKSQGVGITADTINQLPEKLDVDTLTTFTDRAGKYLLLTPKQFEDGVDPDAAAATPTPSPSL